jgi:hypothetical protein
MSLRNSPSFGCGQCYSFIYIEIIFIITNAVKHTKCSRKVKNQKSASSPGIYQALIENFLVGLNCFLGEIVLLTRLDLLNFLGDFFGEVFFALLSLLTNVTTFCKELSLSVRENCRFGFSNALLILIEGTYGLAINEETFSIESCLALLDFLVLSQVYAFLFLFSLKKGRSYTFSLSQTSPESICSCNFLLLPSSEMFIKGKSEKFDSESIVAFL